MLGSKNPSLNSAAKQNKHMDLQSFKPAKSNRSKKSNKSKSSHFQNKFDLLFDFKKMDYINIMAEKMSKAKDFSSSIEVALENLTKIINCRIGQVIVFKQNMVN